MRVCESMVNNPETNFLFEVEEAKVDSYLKVKPCK